MRHWLGRTPDRAGPRPPIRGETLAGDSHPRESPESGVAGAVIRDGSAEQMTARAHNGQARATHLTRALPQLSRSPVCGCYFFAAVFFVPQVFLVLQPAMLWPPCSDFQCRTALRSQHGYHVQAVRANTSVRNCDRVQGERFPGGPLHRLPAVDLDGFRMSTDSRSPPGRSLSTLHMVWIGAGRSRSQKGAPLRKAPGLRSRRGR